MKRVFFVILWCILSTLFAETKVTITWGKKETWVSQTHYQTSLQVHIPPGWKMNAPHNEGDTLVYDPRVEYGESSNISSVQCAWPEGSLLTAEGQVSRVYTQTYEVPLDIILDSRKPADCRIAVKGLSCHTMCYPFDIVLEKKLTPPSGNWHAWLKMLFFAFVGGMVLNIMPCVLPVLGLKMKSFATQSRILFKKSCFFTTAGIVIGFWSLALITGILKFLFQAHVGWGMQLQNPFFCVIMALIMIAGGYAFLGVFHLNAPQWAHKFANKKVSPTFSYILSGMMAVLLATPCSAPFLGTALGFAMTGSMVEIVLFYTVIALGFAIPYILGMILPIERYLPKPGNWMVTFEKTMGVLFLLSAGWLISWPLSAFLPAFSRTIALLAWVILCSIPFILLLRHQTSRPFVKNSLSVLGAISIATLITLPFYREKISTISMVDGNIRWKVYTPEAVAQALRKNNTVFIDVTGMGCTLCMVNKRVYANPAIQNLLTTKNVVCFRADYSHGEKSIYQLLRTYGRVAIPMNVVIHPRYTKGVVLSETLSQSELLRAFRLIKDLAEKKYQKKDISQQDDNT